MSILSIVIPAYNEESGIAEIVNRVLAVSEDLQALGVDDMELIVVDDGSQDKTAEITEELAQHSEKLRLIRHPVNKGYGAALKTGFSQALGDLLGFLDADGTYPPEYFPALVKPALDGGELIIGSRMSGAESDMPVTRRIGNFFFANLLSIVGFQKITDSASGMRVFHRAILERIYPLPDGLNLTPVMSTRAMHEGINMVEVPIPYSERVGRSKLSVVRDGSLFLQSILWTALTYNPVRIFGTIGLIGVGIAALIGLGLVIARLMGITTIGAWGVVALYTALITAVGGVSIFALGATFNYLVTLFYKRPIRQGLFGRPIFNPSIDHYFGVAGLIGLILGVAISIISLILGIQGWDIGRLWLYLLGSAMLTLVSVQLVIYWILMRALEEISKREEITQNAMANG